MIPPILPHVALAIPISGPDLLHMIVELLKMPSGGSIFDKLASNPRLIAGSELAFGRRLTPEDYKQLLTTPDSPLQKAANIERLYFQILIEIIQINSDIMADYEMRQAQASSAQNSQENEIDQNILKDRVDKINREKEEDKKALDKRTKDNDINYNYVIPRQTAVDAVNADKSKLQAVENRIAALSNNVVTALNKRNEKIGEILKERHTALIEEVNREIAGYDDVLGNLRRNLASAQSPEEIAKINRQIEGVESIKELYVEYAEDEKTIVNRTAKFTENPEENLRSAGMAEKDIPPKDIMAKMSGLILDYHTTEGLKKRGNLFNQRVYEEVSINPSIKEALAREPVPIKLPKADLSKLDALMEESEAEINESKAQLRSSKNECKEIQKRISINEDVVNGLDKKYGKMPIPASADEQPKSSPPNISHAQSADKHEHLNGTKEAPKLRAHAIIDKTKQVADSPKPDKPEPSEPNPPRSGFSRH